MTGVQTCALPIFHFSLSCIGEGNGTPFQCSCLENPGVGGAWWAAVYGVPQGGIRLKRLSSSSSSICDSKIFLVWSPVFATLGLVGFFLLIVLPAIEIIINGPTIPIQHYFWSQVFKLLAPCLEKVYFPLFILIWRSRISADL